MPPRTYEISFGGQAGTVLRAEFDDCKVTVGPDTTTLRLALTDQGALHGLLQRIASFGLKLATNRRGEAVRRARQLDLI